MNAMLDHLYTNLVTDPVATWNAADPDWETKGVFRPYWQSNFLDTPVWVHSSLAPLGYIFYPEQCYDGTTQCHIHIYLHGCGMTTRGMGGNEEDMNRFNKYAVSNDLIVVYPDVQYSLKNPEGCWDAWGYSGDDYLTNDSVLANYLKSVIERLAEPVDTDAYNYTAANYLDKGAVGKTLDSLFGFLFALPYYANGARNTFLRFFMNLFGIGPNGTPFDYRGTIEFM